MVRLILVFFKLTLGILFFKLSRMWLMVGDNVFCLHVFNNLAAYDSRK